MRSTAICPPTRFGVDRRVSSCAFRTTEARRCSGFHEDLLGCDGLLMHMERFVVDHHPGGPDVEALDLTKRRHEFAVLAVEALGRHRPEAGGLVEAHAAGVPIATARTHPSGAAHQALCHRRGNAPVDLAGGPDSQAVGNLTVSQRRDGQVPRMGIEHRSDEILMTPRPGSVHVAIGSGLGDAASHRIISGDRAHHDNPQAARTRPPQVLDHGRSRDLVDPRRGVDGLDHRGVDVAEVLGQSVTNTHRLDHCTEVRTLDRCHESGACQLIVVDHDEPSGPARVGGIGALARCFHGPDGAGLW